MRQLLTADHVLTMAPGCPVIEDGAILIEDGRIKAVDPRAAVQTLLLRLRFNVCGTMVLVAVALMTALAAAGLRGVKGIGQAARWLAATIMGAIAIKLVASDSRG